MAPKTTNAAPWPAGNANTKSVTWAGRHSFKATITASGWESAQDGAFGVLVSTKAQRPAVHDKSSYTFRLLAKSSQGDLLDLNLRESHAMKQTFSCPFFCFTIKLSACNITHWRQTYRRRKGGRGVAAFLTPSARSHTYIGSCRQLDLNKILH